MFLICFLFLQKAVHAQQMDCGTVTPTVVSPTQANPIPCFTNLNEIINNCTPVYLRVNFHFFVGNDCAGSPDVNNIEGFPQSAAFSESTQPFGHGIPERMVYGMNQLLANNIPQKLAGGQFAPTAPCVPLRLVLGDVKIHCDVAFKNIQPWDTFHTKYGQYAQPGINIYYSKPAGASNTGEGDYGGPGLVVSIFNTKNTLHEIGHNLDLRHTFRGTDECNDTPDEGVLWDKDCNGVIQGGERNPCNAVLLPTDPWCLGTVCANPLITSPCCNPDNLYNNLMGYSATGTAITDCQINRMFKLLNTNTDPAYACDWIVQIGGQCPPAAAVVGYVPLEQSIDDCNFCLHGGASMNDASHRWQLFLKSANGQLTLVHNSNWILGEAGEYCFSPRSQNLSRRISSNTNYRAILTVKNSCGEEHQAISDFKTPVYACSSTNGGGSVDVPPPVGLISPNPGSGVIYYSFDLEKEGSVQVVVRRMDSSQAPQLLYQNAQQDKEPTTLNFNVSTWNPGMYVFNLISDQGVSTNTFIKQ